MALSQSIQKLNFTRSFLHTANENAALVLPVKWSVGTWGTSQLATGVGFYKAVACLVQSRERNTGYPTIALLIPDLFQSYNVQAALHKPV